MRSIKNAFSLSYRLGVQEHIKKIVIQVTLLNFFILCWSCCLNHLLHKCNVAPDMYITIIRSIINSKECLNSFQIIHISRVENRVYISYPNESTLPLTHVSYSALTELKNEAITEFKFLWCKMVARVFENPLLEYLHVYMMFLTFFQQNLFLFYLGKTVFIKSPIALQSFAKW